MKETPKISLGELNTSIGKYHIIDVRSQKEFSEDHILSSINMPILDDDQRHIVGYTYKQVDKDKALEMGYKILDEKINDYVATLKEIEKPIVVMCFRGGMRSRSVTDFLVKRGINALQLEGGYKEYRKDIKESLEEFDYSKKNLFVLYGFTGTNKTRIINGVDSSIDLEGLANHRGSLFGAVGLKPHTQKMFDTLLYNELSLSGKNILLEGESNKIGDVFISKNLFTEMGRAKFIRIKMSVDRRTRNILEDYFNTEEKIEEIKRIVPKLRSRLGNKKIEELLGLLDDEKYYDFVKILLQEYYDPLYRNTVDNKEYVYTVESDDVDEAIEKIEAFIKNSK